MRQVLVMLLALLAGLSSVLPLHAFVPSGSAAAPPVWYSYGAEDGNLWTRVTAGSEDSPLHVTRFSDPAGRPVRVLYADALSESLAYDITGRLTNVLDRASRATCFDWDDAGNPLSGARQADAGFATVAFGLDLAALMSSVTNEAGACVSRVLRDIPNRTVTETDITAGRNVARFDTAGRVTSVTRPDNVLVSNAVNVLGQTVTVLHDGAEVLGLGWRADGVLLSASNAAASLVWSHSARGIATNETAHISGFAFQVSRSLDAAALPTNTTFGVQSPAFGVRRSFDPAGRLSTVGSAGVPPATALSFALSYDPRDGSLASVSNAVFDETRSRDLLGHVTNITCKSRASGQTLASFACRRDITGLVTQKVAVLTGSAATNAYAYDALGRLTAASNVAYVYDAVGNRLDNGTYTHNRLDGVLHDAAGNVTHYVRAGVAYALAWNTQGQLLSVATNGMPAESYTYDPLGRRVSTTDASGTVCHVYDGDECMADLDASGNPLRSYTWGPGIDDLLAVTVYGATATNTYYAIKDHLGSVHALVDESGQLAAQFSYDAWGTPQISSFIPHPSSFQLRYLFQGREYSGASGLYNFRARWYAPELGRWLSPDPIGLEGGLNLYEFCRNDPVNFVDPYGLKNYGLLVTSGGIGVGPAAFEGGLMYAVDFQTGDVHAYSYIGSGVGIGFGGSANIEAGVIEMDFPQDISGWGFAMSAFAAARDGVGLQVAGTGPYGGGEIGVTVGYAVGAGAGVSGIGTYTWYRVCVRKVTGFSERPCRSAADLLSLYRFHL